jgi:hypothetical protein
MLIIAAFVGIPIALVVGIAFVVQWIGQAMPLVLAGIAVAATLYAIYRFQTSAPSIRRKHEAELFEFVARAEQQQGGLPREITANDLAAALAKRDIRSEPDEIADAVAFPAAKFINGQILRVDRGLTLYPGWSAGRRSQRIALSRP